MKIKNRTTEQTLFSYAYLAPFLIAFFLFTILPILISIFFSFTYFNVLEPPKWVFLQNYLKLFLSGLSSAVYLMHCAKIKTKIRKVVDR